MIDNDVARYCRGLQHLNIQDVAGVSLQGYRAVRAHCRRWWRWRWRWRWRKWLLRHHHQNPHCYWNCHGIVLNVNITAASKVKLWGSKIWQCRLLSTCSLAHNHLFCLQVYNWTHKSWFPLNKKNPRRKRCQVKLECNKDIFDWKQQTVISVMTRICCCDNYKLL